VTEAGQPFDASLVLLHWQGTPACCVQALTHTLCPAVLCRAVTVIMVMTCRAPKVRVQDGAKGDLGVMTFQEAREMSFAQDVSVCAVC
jgi:hypothetical protein